MSSGVLAARGVHFGYGRNEVLSGVDVELRPGELVALLGPNGSGKSTLLRLLLGFRTPKPGIISLGDTPIGSLDRRTIAQQLAFVGQQERFDFDFTVHQVVSMGRNPHLGRFRAMGAVDRTSVDNAMRRTDVYALRTRPLGQLSGGERRRVLLARAFAQQSPLLLLDEPTANLDPLHAHRVLSLVREQVNSGSGALVALHDLSLTLRYCDRAIVLDQGHVAADGKPHDILTPALLASVYGVQATMFQGEDQTPLLNIQGPLQTPQA